MFHITFSSQKLPNIIYSSLNRYQFRAIIYFYFIVQNICTFLNIDLILSYLSPFMQLLFILNLYYSMYTFGKKNYKNEGYYFRSLEENANQQSCKSGTYRILQIVTTKNQPKLRCIDDMDLNILQFGVKTWKTEEENKSE